MRALGHALVVAVLLAVAGCGVPDFGPPVVDGTPAPVAGDEERDQGPPLPKPQDASDSRSLVQLYFHAASSEWNTLDQQVRTFLTDESSTALQAGGRIRLVRMSDWGSPEIRSSSEHRIRVRGEVIGELAENGAVHPVRRPFAHTFVVRYSSERDTWLIDNPPRGYVLSVEALGERYDALPLYFINHWLTASLIPDLRYISKAVEWRKQRSTLVDWLLQGPSPRLASVARNTFPSGTTRSGNVVIERDDVVVNLSREADVADRKDLMLAQLAWTLRPRMSGGLQVRIEGRPVSDRGRTTHPRTAFDSLNAVHALPAEGVAYYVDGYQHVRSLPSRGRQPERPWVLDSAAMGSTDYNTAVVSAAMNRTGDIAALVRSDGERQTLWVGRVRASGGDQGPRLVTYQQISGLPATDSLSRPVWLGSSARETLLVAAAGRVYEVRLRDLRAREVRGPDEVRRVQAIAVAPDGYRAALVAGGHVYLTGVPQLAEGGLALRDIQLVTASISEVVDVSWSRENHLVVAGRSAGAAALFEVSVDGVEIVKLPSPAGEVPDSVTAYPEVDRRGRVLVEHGGRVYEIYSTTVAAPGGAEAHPVGSAPFFAH